MFRVSKAATVAVFALLICVVNVNFANSQEIKSENNREITLDLPGGEGYSVVTGEEDVKIAERIMGELLAMRGAATGDIMVAAAKKLLGTPYVAGTLETGDDEVLRVYLTKTDCILFVETCMNLALTVKMYGEEYSFVKFADLVRRSRYREGVVRNYSDRIHYTTEWIRQGETLGILTDESKNFGGVVLDHPIFYMSKNFKLYKHLKDADAPKDDCCGLDASSNARKSAQEMAALDLQVIRETEERLNSVPFYYIPQGSIRKAGGKIRSGDIIGYMSATAGLDIAHVAMAYVENGKVGFIHASMADMKVVVDKMSVDEYVSSRKSLTGIKVMRVK